MGTSSLLRLIVIVALLALASYRVAASDFNIGALGDEKSVPRFTYDRHLLGMKVEYLHRINVGDIEGLRSELQEWMVWDCLAIWELVQKDGLLSSKEREQAYDQLRLVAIQHEKYPVAKWNENE